MITAQDELNVLMDKKVDLEIALREKIVDLLSQFAMDTGWYVNQMNVEIIEATAIGDSQLRFIPADITTRLAFITKGGERVFIS